jgi:hypothetical protein
MKKHQILSQSGRSMVEMLGVLMIIGILSIMGLLGYTKAMDKHALNKQAQQMHDLFAGLIVFSNLPGIAQVTTLSEYLEAFENLGYLPDTLVATANYNKWQDYYGNIISFVALDTSSVWIYLYPSTADQFVNIVQVLKQFSNRVNLANCDHCDTDFWAYGDRLCATQGSCLSAMTLADFQVAYEKYRTGMTLRVGIYRK